MHIGGTIWAQTPTGAINNTTRTAASIGLPGAGAGCSAGATKDTQTSYATIYNGNNSTNFTLGGRLDVNSGTLGLGARGNGDTIRIGGGSTLTQANHANSLAIGVNTQIGAGNATALGAGAKASLAGSVALGQGSTTTAGTKVSSSLVNGLTFSGFAGTLSDTNRVVGVGGRQIQGVAAGAVSATSTDAINGSQLYATQNVIANVAKNSNGTLSAAGRAALRTYNVDDSGTLEQNGILDAIRNMNEQGIKFFHTNDGVVNSTKDGYSEEDSNANAAYSTAIGYKALVSKNAVAGLAIGPASLADGAYSVALGAESVARDAHVAAGTTDSAYTYGGLNDNNVAAKATKATRVASIGAEGKERQLQHVAAGVISPTSTDAVNGSQLYYTNKAVENNTRAINQLRGDVHKMDRNLRAGVAGAYAAASLGQVYLPGKTQVSLGTGYYRGESAVALGVSRVSDNGKVQVRLLGSTNSRGDTGAGASVSYLW